MRYAALILILLAGATTASHPQDGKSFLCITDSSVGYNFEQSSKSWQGKIFRVDGGKYLVRPTTPDDARYEGGPAPKQKYGVWRIGEDKPTLLCKDGVSEANWLHCEGRGNQQFIMNVRSNRFMHIFPGSYMTSTFDWETDEGGEFKKDENGHLIDIDIEDAGGNSPFMDIGKCSVL